MMEHLGLNTPYFGIGLSVILFLVGTYLKKQMDSSCLRHYFSVWLVVLYF